MAEEQLDWRFRAGRYLGEISALTFLRFPSEFSSLPLLLAGCGSQMLLFDIELARIRSSFQVFEGIRVHGISSLFLSWDEKSSSSAGFTFNVAVFGERRVKLYRLCISDKCESLISLYSLPKFSYWVLDVCFLKRTSKAFSSQGNFLVAIGCSDNSINLWDISESVMILKVDSSERCLLYSMRLWGDDIEALCIASGTIFNEIVVWRVVSYRGCASSTNQVEDHSDSIDDAHYLHHQYEVVNICRLAGHEGSIFRIAWSPDGSKLVSVSDDRSARVWTPHLEREYSENAKEVVVLFGHDARIWDCCIYDSLIITAGEDCTCRAWGLDGKQLRIIKEHMGRGVWRCLYDPNSLLLITAGFDSAIKVHQLDAAFSRAFDDHDGVIEDGKREIFTACMPRSLNNVRLLDSKSEYIRCLRFSNEATFYVATNHGFLYHVKLSETGDVNWTELVCLIEEIAIVCMDLLPQRSSVLSSAVEDWIAVGDGRGKVTVVKVTTDVFPPKVSLLFNWQAERERQLLGTFWCKSLGPRYIFTANPRGLLKLWKLYDHAPCDSQNTTTRYDVSLEAEFMSCFGVRILCLDASLEENSLLCGDLRGNLILFPLPKDFLSGITVASGTKISPSNYFKGAHGISTVTSVAFAVANSNHAQIRSTGGDGCICHLEFNRGQQKLEFIGMRQVKELSLIQSISSDRNCIHDLTSDNYATGFASTDFTIWNLVTESKVLRIHCGGWRRPHSYYLGDVPELKNCFAYVKDEIIYIHRFWDPVSESRIYPLNMHVQFHGRELHSLCFISEGSKLSTNKSHDMLSKSSWIATGCEDGTVRLTRYTPGTEGWSASNLLGEHVGGSAVRAICSVSKTHSTESDRLGIHGERVHQQPDFEGREDLFLLISVGAKRVLTSWIQKCRNWEKKQYMDSNLPFRKMDHDNELHLGLSSPFTFQWLSSDMPMKCSTLLKKSDDNEKNTATNSSNTISDVKSELLRPRKENMEQKHWITEKSEDDWRYMAVTAFLVRSSCSRFSVCFVVVACSDATLSVRALILPHRLWFDVVLVPLSSPILALQHVVIPKCQFGNIFIVISGATDGSIAFWDLTESVEAFMQQLSTWDSEMLGDYQKRPRTGRGSQGGRWRRSLNNNRTKLRPTSVSLSRKGEEGRTINTSIQDSSEISLQRNIPEVNEALTGHPISSTTDPEAITSDSSFLKCEIHPMHVLKNVHQSGVNCLHVSTMKFSESHDSCFVYNVVSGGDDQGLSSLTFEIELMTGSHISEILTPEFLNSTTKSDGCISDFKNSNMYRYRFPNLQRVDSAHSSAVKGVWTDGTWVFSAGLDQRMRCWRGLGQSKLFEYAHLIISVPEPEAIDVRLWSRNHYQIAVAGRGMQIIEFSASTRIDL